MEEEIEKQLDCNAEKSNLTVAHVKSILKVCIYRYFVMPKCVEPCDRVEPSPLLLWPYIGILYQPWMVDGDDCRVIGRMNE
jgi:hypothetical protein